MFTHLYKLIWNKKGKNFLLMLEVLVSFMVLFGVFTMVVDYYGNYRRPMGLDESNVWLASYNNTLETKSNDSMVMFYENIRRSVSSMPQVESVSYTGDNVPFSGTTNSTGITHNKQRIDRVNNYFVDVSYDDVLKMQLLGGRWYERGDVPVANSLVIINRSLSEKTFGTISAVGKTLGDFEDKQKMRVIGVVEDTKTHGDYSRGGDGIYRLIDTGGYRWLGSLMVRVKPEADAAFESRLYKLLAGQMRNANVEIVHMEDMRASKNRFSLIQVIVVLVIAGFLIINVALGLFGVLWYSINIRRGEIGLRRAVGATGRSISSQLVSEALILASLALVIGVFFAVQFPLLNLFDLASSVYLTSILISIIFIYVLVVICALYPGKQAAAIFPAVALHED